jgi:hypothetical protein
LIRAGVRTAAALLVCWDLIGQSLEFGVRAGVPLTRAVRGRTFDRYTAGPTLQVTLGRGFGIGADFLPRHERWDLPVTLRYRIGGSTGRLFARAGVSFNHVFRMDDPRAELRHRGTYGPVIGGGLRLRCKLFWLEPEVRLTRWVDRNIGVRDSLLRSNLTQVDILAGLIF